MGLWALAGSHVMAYKGDGFVPAWFVESWPKGKRLAHQLIAAGLWTEGEKDGVPGYIFHDWDDYQPTAEEIEKEREASRERQRKFREARRLARANGTSDA